MKRNTRLTALVWLLATAPAAAQDCGDAWDRGQTSGLDPASIALTLYDRGCFGGGGDEEPWVVEARRRLDAASGGPEMPAATVGLLLSLEARARNIDRAIDPDRKLAESLRLAAQKIRANEPTAEVLAPANWQGYGEPGMVPFADGLNVSEWIDANCAGVTMTRCGPGLEPLRIITLTEFGLTKFLAAPVIEEMADRYSARVRKWEAYRTQALPMYWWEWWLNGVVMRAYDDRPLDPETGAPLGPPTIPNSQFIFLHPAPGFSWVDTGSGGDGRPAVYLEWAGYNRWSWRDDGSMGLALGASLVTVFANHDDADTMGIGLMFHIDNSIHVGTVLNDGEFGMVFGLDFAGLIRGSGLLNGSPSASAMSRRMME